MLAMRQLSLALRCIRCRRWVQPAKGEDQLIGTGYRHIIVDDRVSRFLTAPRLKPSSRFRTALAYDWDHKRALDNGIQRRVAKANQIEQRAATDETSRPATYILRHARRCDLKANPGGLPSKCSFQPHLRCIGAL